MRSVHTAFRDQDQLDPSGTFELRMRSIEVSMTHMLHPTVGEFCIYLGPSSLGVRRGLCTRFSATLHCLSPSLGLNGCRGSLL